MSLFLVVLALAPLHLGSNRAVSSAILDTAIGLLCVATAIVMLFRRDRLAMPFSVVVSMLLFIGAVAWAWAQSSPELQLEWHHPVWQLLDRFELEPSSAIAIDVALPMGAVAELLAVMGAFWLGFALCQRSHRASRLLSGVVFITAAYGLVGFYIVLTGWKPWDDLDNLKVVTSTFANRNHFATYANIGIVVALALIFGRQRVQDQNLVPLHVVWLRALISPLEKSPFRLVALAIGLVALLGTQSRGGFLSLFVAFALFFILQRQSLAAGGKRMLLVTTTFLTLAVTLLLLIGQPVLSRFDDIGGNADIEGGGRLSAYVRTYELIEQRPYLGYGLGTFDSMFLMNTDERFTKHFDHAHNDYLEIVAGLGLPAGVAFILAVVIPAMRCARFTGIGEGRYRRFAMAGLLASVAVGVHALVDFSLTIPAVAVTFAAVLGASCASCRQSS